MEEPEIEEEEIKEEPSVEPENIAIVEHEVAPKVAPEPAEEVESEPEFVAKEEILFASEDEVFEEEEAEIVVIAEPTPEPEPVAAPEPEPVVAPEPQPEPEKPAKSPRKPAMESLFSAEEIQRKPRSKHQRMMAIYGEAQPKQEKAVDISKIFDMDDDDIFEIKVVNNRPQQESVAKKAAPVAEEGGNA